MRAHTLVRGERLSMGDLVDLVERLTIHGSITFEECEIWNWDNALIPIDARNRVTVRRSTIYGGDEP